jgi:hypothetical protein
MARSVYFLMPNESAVAFVRPGTPCATEQRHPETNSKLPLLMPLPSAWAQV